MITEILQTAGNRLLEFDIESVDRITRLQGKVFKLEVDVLDREIYFIPVEHGLEIKDHWSGTVDITLRGSPAALAAFGLKQKGVPNRLFAERKVSIEGDVELAQDFQNIISRLDIDFEEMLSRYVGDIAAHQLGRGFRVLRDWTQEAGGNLASNISEYLVEESRVLAPGWRVATFVDRVDTLRADVDRLEQRVKRLQSC